ncbi:MAG: hypothetical protein IKT41_01320 [Clostridia bacterium]|nr:hypothetical protein [Clostridia bacterium]
MREIRIENLNVQNLIHVVSAEKEASIFLIRRREYAFFMEQAAMTNEMKMNFITWYGKNPIKTDIKFKTFCDEFYLIESITVENNLIYGYSWSTDLYKNQIVIEAE